MESSFYPRVKQLSAGRLGFSLAVPNLTSNQNKRYSLYCKLENLSHQKMSPLTIINESKSLRNAIIPHKTSIALSRLMSQPGLKLLSCLS